MVLPQLIFPLILVLCIGMYRRKLEEPGTVLLQINSTTKLQQSLQQYQTGGDAAKLILAMSLI